MADSESNNEQTEIPSPYFAAPDRLDDFQTLKSRCFEKSGLSVGSYRCDRGGLGITEANPISNLYMAVINLRPLGAHWGWRDGTYSKVPAMRAGTLACLDFRESWISDVPHPFHTVHLFVPQQAFDALSDELGAPRILGLSCPNTSEQVDDTMSHLAMSLIPAMARPHEVNTLYADYVFDAIRLHLAAKYGGLRLAETARRGGLATWQERRAKDMMRNRLSEDLSVSDIARECKLSVSHFARAFTRSAGLSPHHWLLERRIEKAKDLLLSCGLSLAEIAKACGFADQCHLARTFSRKMGISPGAWRRSLTTKGSIF